MKDIVNGCILGVTLLFVFFFGLHYGQADMVPSPSPSPSASVVVAPVQQPAAQYCLVLDKDNGFVRCETAEVVCYKLGQQAALPVGNCFVKQVQAKPEAPKAK